MTLARYDAVADFYEAGWSDSSRDPSCEALLDVLGPVAGLRVLDIACGHGRITRELARRGAEVVGVDISGSLISKAQVIEDAEPLGIRYVHADVMSHAWLDDSAFDSVVCSFALSDIDDLDACLATVARRLRPGEAVDFPRASDCLLLRCTRVVEGYVQYPDGGFSRLGQLCRAARRGPRPGFDRQAVACSEGC
jgi:ubiquinone/menaquinone biosynthesis C-methylase UbiE